jgi:hypothetical protein
MSISGDTYNFTEENVNKAPAYEGVYALYDGNECIYIGRGEGKEGVRARLQAHQRGDEGECTQSATGYKRESSDNPKIAEGLLLQEYKKEHGELPRCNDIMP